MAEEVRLIYSKREPEAVEGFVINGDALVLPWKNTPSGREDYLFFPGDGGYQLGISQPESEPKFLRRRVSWNPSGEQAQDAISYAWQVFQERSRGD